MFFRTLAIAAALSAISLATTAQPADATSATVTSNEGSAAASASSVSTSSSRRAALPGGSVMTTAVMERMWTMREKSYRDAGISDDRIEKLKELELKAYTAAQNGEKLDYKALREERSRIITPEEDKKLQEARAKRANATRAAAGQTSASATSGTSAGASSTDSASTSGSATSSSSGKSDEKK
jgi:hypothetical protein